MDPGSSNKLKNYLETGKPETAEPPTKTRRKLGSKRVQLDKCMHKVIMRGMCADCGVDIESIESCNIANVSMVHGAPELLINAELAYELGNKDRDNLLKNRKLVLLVDLDETIIHTTDRLPMHEEMSMHVIGYELHNCIYYTKIRPFVQQFLECCNKFFEMHVFTFGQRDYAYKVVKFIDPTKKFFGDRILTREEFYSSTDKVKNLRHLFPSGEEMVVMIDDRKEVWLNSDAHILIRPYRYFAGVYDINDPMKLPLIPTKQFSTESKKLNNQKNLIMNETQIDVESVSFPLNKNKELNDDAKEEINESELEKNDNEQNQKDCEVNLLQEVGNIDKRTEESDVKKNDNEQNQKDCEVNLLQEVGNIDKRTEESDVKKNDNEQNQKDCEVNLLQEVGKMNTKLKEDWDSDDYLLNFQKVLINIHSKFYEWYDELRNTKALNTLNVKTVIIRLRQKVLEGEYIVLSGIIPLKTDPRTNDLVILAEKFGAIVQMEIDGNTTVIVAAIPDTEKVKLGFALKIPVVNVNWLKDCIYTWENVTTDKYLFPSKY